MERLGVPTVTVITVPFMGLAKTVAAAENVLDPCFVAVPHPVGMLPAAQVQKKAEDAFAEILRAATEWQPSEKDAATKAAYPAERVEVKGTITELNDDFLRRGWSLGLPVVPPTPERVSAMLRGTSHRPDMVLGQVPPQKGTLTVELAAVNAVMAGCRPEYLPLLITTLQAFLIPEVNWRGSLATTGTTQFVAIVNGPVVREIGIATGQGAAGKGYHANGSIGYALNLVAYNVGGSRPPAIDRSTLASPADYVCWVFGENEDALPAGWEPLHVERGFKHEDSVVTVMCAYPPIENIDHWSINTEEYLRWWGSLVNPLHNIGGPCKAMMLEQNPIIALGPEHAQLIAAEGWTKADFCQALWERARLPLSTWPSQCADMPRLRNNLGELTPETLIPITLKPEQFLIVIGGGDGKHSHYFPPFLGAFPASRLVTR